MNLKYTNLRYYNYKKMNENNILSFDIDIIDLDKELNNGEIIPFTFVASDEDQYNTTKLNKIVFKDFKNGKIDLDEIKEYESPESIEILRYEKQREIKDFKNYLLNSTGVYYKDDTFSIDDKALLRISGVIQSLSISIQNGLLKEDVKQIWVSQSDNLHYFSFEDLLELSNLMLKEVQEIILRANYLNYEIIPNITDKRELSLLDWYYDYESDNINE